MINNPFVIAGKIPEKYFCDRKNDTKKLKEYIINHNNVVLISPRRMGKSGLIWHTFEDPDIYYNYKTLYIDILQSSSLKEFVFILGKEIFKEIVKGRQKLFNVFLKTIRSLNAKFSIDTLTGMPNLNIGLGDIIDPMLTLEEIFRFIEEYDKRCIIAIDEFQQITKYPEKNIEAILRTHIQRCSNANFIFAGSERHIMQAIFIDYKRPFYQSASFMELNSIPENLYIEFAIKQFDSYGKTLTREAVEKLYNLFGGFTFYMQKTLNVAFYKTEENEICDLKKIRESIMEILESNDSLYRQILSNIPEKQKDLLYSLAIEGGSNGITSSSFIKKYNLLSASSVQSASRQLLHQDYITRYENYYTLTDKFFALWIQQNYGNLKL